MRNEVTLLSALLLTTIAPQLRAQDIVIRAMDGKNGKPLSSKRLVIWTFNNLSERMTSKGQQLELHTDRNGIARIPVNEITRSHFQVWVDAEHQCVDQPNNIAISVNEILSSGVTERNSCSDHIAAAKTPGTLIIYARTASFMEGMAW